MFVVRVDIGGPSSAIIPSLGNGRSNVGAPRDTRRSRRSHEFYARTTNLIDAWSRVPLRDR